MKKRRELKASNTSLEHIDYCELCKTTRKNARSDLRRYINQIVERTLENRKG